MDQQPPTPFDTVGDEPVEARIVAWVLGEASTFEAAELERLCEERPELLVFRRRMRALHGLLTEAEASESDHTWKLPPEKRKLLDEICGEEKIVRLDAEKEQSIRRNGRQTILAIAACVVLTIAVVKLIGPISLMSPMETADTKEMRAAVRAETPSEESLQALNKAVRDQEDKVEERRKVLASIVRSKGIIYKGQDSFYGQSGVDEDQAARGALQTYNDLQTQKMQIESQVNSLLKYDSEELMRYASGLDLPDNIIKNLYPQYLQATREIRDLKNNGLEDQHPKVSAAVENVGAMKRQLDEGVVNLRATLQAQLAMTSDRLKNVEMMKNDTHEEAIKRGLDAQDYVDAKRDFEADQERLQQMKLKQIELGIQTRLQDGSLAAKGSSRQAPASPAAPVASPAKRNDAAGKEMTMSLAKAKEGFKEDQQDKKRARLTAATKAEQPAVEMESKLPELAESSKLESQPRQPATGWAGSASAGGGMGLGGEKKDLGSAAGSFADAEQLSGGERDVAGTALAGSVTNGLRSGDQAINRNNIDAILNNPNRTAGSAFIDPAAAASRSEMKALKDAPAASMPTLAAKQSAATPAEPQTATAAPGKAKTDLIRTNPALTNEQTGNIDQVRRGLYTAEGNLNLGKYDESKKAYEDVLKADPSNAAARRGLEKVDRETSASYRAAYDHTRAELLAQVDAAWELKVPAEKDAAARSGIYYESSQVPTPSFDLKKRFKEEGGKGLEQQEGKLATYTGFAVPQIEMGNFTAGGSHPMNLRGGSEQAEFSSKLALGVELSSRFTGLPQEQREVDWYGEVSNDSDPFAEPSEYLFRGYDLAAKEAKPAAVNLADLMEEIPASENPYSTFSLNISDASFQLAKAALAKGERPDPVSIKTEQFYNAVDYGDPAPASNEPVAATVEQSAHPIIPGRTLVRVALRTGSVGRSALQPLRLTLLVDQSGSMVREDRRASMEHALSQLGVLLTKADLVTVIGFSRSPHILAEVMTGDQSAKLSGLVNQTASEGGTNLEEAMKLAGEKAVEHQLAGAQNRIVLFTDGAANLGDANPERLAAQVKSFRQKGLSFDIAGIGADGLNDRLLSELARNGNGRYYVVGSENNDSFAKQLAGAFRPAAENVKVQVNFNPQRVGRYKLIGFEKDRLKTEDFRNDAVDAAELAADEAGVAIYQVEPIAGGSGEIGEVSVRFRDAASKEMVERTWTIPHDTQATAFDRATPSMQLAGLSLLAAEKLKGGPMADAIDFKLLADPAASVKQFYGASARVGEMLQVIEKLK